MIRSSILSVTHDQRLQLILVGFASVPSWKAAGFGAPSPSPPRCWWGWASKPLYAAGLCLIANTAPVAFGAMGIPVIVAGRCRASTPSIIGQMAGASCPS